MFFCSERQAAAHGETRDSRWERLHKHKAARRRAGRPFQNHGVRAERSVLPLRLGIGSTPRREEREHARESEPERCADAMVEGRVVRKLLGGTALDWRGALSADGGGEF